jgi:hypothetical protein
MLIAAPVEAIVGVNPEMVGAPELGKTVKLALLLAEPEGDVTVIAPVLLPAGTKAIT